MDLASLVPDRPELDDLGALALEVAWQCGRLVRDDRPRDLDVAATKTSATDVVTVMDQRSERLASDLLGRARPRDGQFGEEGLRVTGESGVTWVVDPIDGTVNYLYGIPVYAVSVAAVVGDPGTPGAWRPVAGAVVNPVTGAAYCATFGGGARLVTARETRPLVFSPAESLAQSLVGVGFSYSAEVRTEQGEVLLRVLPRVRDIRRAGSAALDLCHVATGELDAYYERGIHPWDMAAGWLVATEAGACVRGVGGADPDRRLTMAGSPAILEELAPLVEPPA